jgi:hypothetical protein
MNATTGRVLIAFAAAVCLVALGGLEMLTERAGMDRAAVSALRPGVVERDPVWDTIAPAEAPNPALDTAHLTMAGQGGRMTVLDVDEKAGRLVAVSGSGRVLESEVDRRTVVVNEGKPVGRVALLQAGDVIRFEPATGQVRTIVLLRQAGRQLESPDQ